MAPAWRATAIASATSDSAPRTSAALPRRSHTGPTTGAACGVLIVEISGCSVRLPFESDVLGILLGPPVHAHMRGVDVDEGHLVGAG